MSQTTHLTRRGGVWYYRRRVPLGLVAAIGKQEIQFSLDTGDLGEAKKRRAVEDLKWAARFEAIDQQPASTAATNELFGAPTPARPPLSEPEVILLVQNYVARVDERSSRRLAIDPPDSESQKAEIKTDIEVGLGILKDRDDPRADELVYDAGEKILREAARPIDDSQVPYAAFAELVRRGLLELQRRKLGRIDDNHGQAFFDQTFDARRPQELTFAELAAQFLQMTEDEASANGTSKKWVDKQRANIALLKEVIGTSTPINNVDFDMCLRVRSVLARIPAHRGKLYSGLTIAEIVAQGETVGGPPLLSPVTQDQYLATLKAVLDLAARKRVISVNPAHGMRPLKKDTVGASAKRIPFTPEQLQQLLQSSYYQECAKHSPAYKHDKSGWRFWLPLMCLFMGLRPNEACQARAADVRHTEKGTWYVDVVASTDEDDGAETAKSLKTATSRRRAPIHPELLAIGFVEYVQERMKTSPNALLFGGLKADPYGNYAKYPLKRFRERYLPKAIALKPRQSFYSLRHNFRDALRRIDAPPDALQALGGWSQGALVSDNYGDKANPDYQIRFMSQVSFPGLNLRYLHTQR